MTDLGRMFEDARAGGASYYQALRAVERKTGLDPETIKRTLRRARRRKAAPPDRKENG